jgi:pimeloyl-ACP methyl ester carboxylesterase
VPTVLVNGVSLYYEEHGAGEPILCIHGTLSSAALWSEAAAELGTRGRAIVYDRRGSPAASVRSRLSPTCTCTPTMWRR